MTVDSKHRDWLGGVLGFQLVAPQDNSAVYAECLKVFIKSKDIEAAVDATGKTELATKLENLSKQKLDTPEKLKEAKKQANLIAEEATVFLTKVQDDLQVKFGQYKDALLFSKNVLSSQDGSTPLAEQAQKISTFHTEATELRKKHNYKLATEKLAEGKKLYDEIIKDGAQISKDRGEIQNEVNDAKTQEEQAFKLFVGDKKEMRRLVADPKFLEVLAGGVGSTENSPALQQMQKVFDAALARFDKLKKTGLSPLDAADIALANIPRAFWPDRAIREIDMFLRVEQAIELEQGQAEAKSISDGVSRFQELYEYPNMAVGTTGDYIGYDLRNKLGLPTDKELPKVGSEAYNNLPKDQQKLLQVGEAFGHATKGAEALGVFMKAIDVISKISEASGEHEGPVQKRIAEYERNLALYDILFQAEKFALNIAKDVVPALGAVAAGIDMVKAAIEAARYFKMLSDITKLGAKAERDPKSVVYLPLIRMAKNTRIQAAEKVLSFVENALVTAGKGAEVSGVGAVVGLAIDVTGKIIAQGGKFVFANIKWSDAKKAQKNILKAKGPPLDREAVEMVFKYSNKYATYCLAIAAVEENDPWAVRYCLTQGLKESEVKDESTSVQVLRKYILIHGNIDDDQKTFSEDTLIGRGLTRASKFVLGLGDDVTDVLRDRDRTIAYEPPDIPDEESPTGRSPNPNFKNLTTKPELTRLCWQLVKKEAAPLGWLDEKSGLGDELDAFNLEKKAWEDHKSKNPDYLKKPTKADVEAAEVFLSQIGDLREALTNFTPFANDQRTIHAPMNDFASRLVALVNDEELEFRAEYSVFSDIFYSTDQDAVKEISEKVTQLKQEKQNHGKEVDSKLHELIAAQEWESPFGKCKLDDYLDIVCEKLTIDRGSIETDFNDALRTLKETVLFLDARDIAGASTIETLEKSFSSIAKKLQKSAKQSLTTLAVLARNVRDRNVTQPTSQIKDPASISADVWQEAIDTAISEGMTKPPKSKIVDYMREYQSKKSKYEKTGIDLHSSSAISDLGLVQIALDDFEAVDAEGLPFVPMTNFVAKLRSLIEADIKKLEAPPQSPWKHIDPVLLTADWWEKNKKAAIENHLHDKTTGIRLALKTYMKHREPYDTLVSKTPTAPVPDTIRDPLLTSIDSLTKAVGEFDPLTRGGKTHIGGANMKKAMLKEISTKRADLLKKCPIQYKSKPPATVAEITEKAWTDAKAEYIQYGLVDKKTGITKAIKGFVSAKAKVDKGSPTPKVIENFRRSRDMLVKVANSASLLGADGNVFELAAQYVAAIKQIVNDID